MEVQSQPSCGCGDGDGLPRLCVSNEEQNWGNAVASRKGGPPMMQLVLSLALGIVLFLVLYVLARRSPSVEGSAQAVLEARQALVALQGDLLPAETLTRIFDKRDFEYVVARAPLQIQELFLQERQRIAISWVDQIRKQISSLEGFHRGTARFYSRLSLRTELQLAGDFLMLS